LEDAARRLIVSGAKKREEVDAMDVSDQGALLRVRDGGEQPVTPLELFFDLVFVFAVTQLSHLLLEHLTLRGTLETLFLLLAVWWAWIRMTWFTNWFDPEGSPVRLMLIAVMLSSLLMSVAIPEAFGERGLMFALAFVAIQVGRTGFALIALRRSLGTSHPLSINFERVLCWVVASGIVWIIGGLLEGEARYALWVLALVLDYGSLLIGFYTPGLGRSRSEAWTIEAGHFAERCQLFIIIALGESILVTGTTFSEIGASTATVTAFVVAFLGSVGLWWIYFALSYVAARTVSSSSEDPRRLAVSADVYFHVPMIAGIIAIAAADELSVAHPTEQGTLASVALTLAGTGLFLAGHALFKWAVLGVASWSHVVAIAALIALVPAGVTMPALALSGAAGLIVVGVAVWDTLAYRGGVRSPRRQPRECKGGTIHPPSGKGRSANFACSAFSEVPTSPSGLPRSRVRRRRCCRRRRSPPRPDPPGTS
jgi:low temperature requirement protein LtrA